jgi:glycosyltransferase involved in cell wall biosynthesis
MELESLTRRSRVDNERFRRRSCPPSRCSETPLKIVIATSWPPMRGVSPYAVSLVESLCERRDGEPAETTEPLPAGDVSLLTFKRYYPGPLYPGENPIDPDGRPPEINGLNVIAALDFINPFNWRRVGETLDANVLHLQHWSWPLGLIWRRVIAGYRSKNPNGRVVLTLHNPAMHDSGNGWLARRKNAIYRSPLPLCDSIIVHHQGMAGALAASYPSASVSVIEHIPIVPQALESVRTECETISPAALRESLKLPATGRLALFFGNIRPYKGLDTAIDALAQANARGAGWKLIIAGDAWMDTTTYQRQAEALGVAESVVWKLGFQPEPVLLKLLMASDAVLLPYRDFASSSGAVSLAGWSGSAILASDLPGLASPGLDDIIRLDPMNAAVWADALASVSETELDADARKNRLDRYAQSVRDSRRQIVLRHIQCYAGSTR